MAIAGLVVFEAGRESSGLESKAEQRVLMEDEGRKVIIPALAHLDMT